MSFRNGIIWAALTILISMLLSSSSAYAAFGAGPSKRILIIVLDGLRPDYVRQDLMPNLYALGQKGVVCTDHHSVFPTVTRVNASAIVTGAYPVHNGLLANTIYIPEVDPRKGISTGDAKKLMKVDEATKGNLLTVPSLGEILAGHGKKLLVISSGSSGSAFLLNRKERGFGIINVETILPESDRDTIEGTIGPAPAEATPNSAQNAWAVDAYTKIALDHYAPDVTIMWISDPDHTAHEVGIGTPKMLEALKADDVLIGRILAAHEEKGLAGSVDIMVTSDHGFSTQTGPGDVSKLLIDHGLKQSRESTDVIDVDGALYVSNHDPKKIGAIVQVLQETDWIGPIFTHAAKPGAADGTVPGTFSFDVIHWNHPRASDIFVDATWSDAANEQGWKGATTLPKGAGHGTSSPYDVHNTLIAFGPNFKEKLADPVPTANVDLAPTVCTLLDMKPSATMDGRVISEILKSGPSPDSVKVERKAITADAPIASGKFRAELSISEVGGERYINYGKATREQKTP